MTLESDKNALKMLKNLEKTWYNHRFQFIADMIRSSAEPWEESETPTVRDMCYDLMYHSRLLKEWQSNFEEFVAKKIKRLEALIKKEE